MGIGWYSGSGVVPLLPVALAPALLVLVICFAVLSGTSDPALLSRIFSLSSGVFSLVLGVFTSVGEPIPWKKWLMDISLVEILELLEAMSK